MWWTRTNRLPIKNFLFLTQGAKYFSVHSMAGKAVAGYIPSTLAGQPSTFHPQPSMVNPKLPTLNPQPPTLHPNLSTLRLDIEWAVKLGIEG